ncbi:MAG: sugar transferase [Acholeplasmatales bacterium]|nr:sugar transferase [Acholeplasmatales bacterium]
MYRHFFKRFYDILFSFLGIVVLSPLFIILIIVGAIVMKGNPFFTQLRPGKNEKIFKLIKFRTMTNAEDKDGNLLPDEKRLVKYGKFLRATSLDEIPELFNIFIGNMSIIGPRPLLVEYLPWYNEEEKHRHDVRPGLTGLAQVSGRNNLSWNDRFKTDVRYVKSISFFMDLKIVFLTIGKVLKHSDVSEDTNKTEGNFAKIRQKEIENKE